jgi:hypothetical protein
MEGRFMLMLLSPKGSAAKKPKGQDEAVSADSAE